MQDVIMQTKDEITRLGEENSQHRDTIDDLLGEVQNFKIAKKELKRKAADISIKVGCTLKH